jgi:mono/diheme cytochrome c family protein
VTLFCRNSRNWGILGRVGWNGMMEIVVRKNGGFIALAALSLAGIGGEVALAEQQKPISESEQIAEGEAIFHLYCAPCHGRDARGDGPVAADLKTEPPSLREIAKRRGGNFDERAIIAYIDGRDMPRAHGTPEMPVWGSLFRYIAEVSDTLASDQQAIENKAQERILLLVKYLETIQDK